MHCLFFFVETSIQGGVITTKDIRFLVDFLLPRSLFDSEDQVMRSFYFKGCGFTSMEMLHEIHLVTSRHRRNSYIFSVCINAL